MVPPRPLTPSAAYAVLRHRSIVCSSDLSNQGPPRPCLGPALQSSPDPPPGAVPLGPPLIAPPQTHLIGSRSPWHPNLARAPRSLRPALVCILNVPNDAVSIQLLYRNLLDIHCKHTASQLHVAEPVLRHVVCCWISSDKCHTWSKYFHRVTSADVSWVGQVFENSLNTVYSFPQWGHSYGLLLLCTRCLCCCKLLDWLKLLSHSEHLCGFSPVWILVWVFKCPDSTDCVCVFADSELLSIIWLILIWYLNWNVVIRWT